MYFIRIPQTLHNKTHKEQEIIAADFQMNPGLSLQLRNLHRVPSFFRAPWISANSPKLNIAAAKLHPQLWICKANLPSFSCYRWISKRFKSAYFYSSAVRTWNWQREQPATTDSCAVAAAFSHRPAVALLGRQAIWPVGCLCTCTFKPHKAGNAEHSFIMFTAISLHFKSERSNKSGVGKKGSYCALQYRRTKDVCHQKNDTVIALSAVDGNKFFCEEI